MDTKIPLTVVAIPVFNRAHLIEETLSSIKNQTKSQYIVLSLVDDNSTDNSFEICKSFAQDHNDVFFDVLVSRNESNLGAGAAADRAIKQALFCLSKD